MQPHRSGASACLPGGSAQKSARVAADIERESANHDVAEAFIERLIGRCERLASLPGLLGRARPELGDGYRSASFGDYVIVMRYSDEAGARSHLYIVEIVHGRRDLKAHFGS